MPSHIFSGKTQDVVFVTGTLKDSQLLNDGKSAVKPQYLEHRQLVYHG